MMFSRNLRRNGALLLKTLPNRRSVGIGKYIAWKADCYVIQLRQFSDKSSDKKDEIKTPQSEPIKEQEGNPLDSKHFNSPQPSSPNAKPSYYGATVQRIGSTLHFAEQKYEDFEKQIMSSIRESNRRRFRIYFFGSIAAIIAVSIVFARPIKNAVTRQTADIAKETLENESLKIQTQELAMAVVQTVLNDKEITQHAATFLRQASTTPETQKALLELTLHVLRHPQTLEELTGLSKQLIDNLSKDTKVIKQLSDTFVEVLNDPHLQVVAVEILAKLFQDPQILQASMELFNNVIKQPEVRMATLELAQQTSTEILEDEEVLTQSRQFIAGVMGDDVLQKEGGDALMNTIYHALRPGVIRMVGCGLVVVSFVALRLFLSPF